MKNRKYIFQFTAKLKHTTSESVGKTFSYREIKFNSAGHLRDRLQTYVFLNISKFI